MKYKYTYNFRMSDGKTYQLWEEHDEYVDEECIFNNLAELKFVAGYLMCTRKRILVNMAHVMTVSVKIEETP